MKQIKFGKSSIWLFAAAMLWFTSCIDGYKEDITWSPGVENVTLESPAADKVTITPSADGTELTINWPVVPGAGGYQFSLYIVDDPENPVAVGEENQIVDGCSAKRIMQEDTNYKVVIKTLGNPKYNNQEAAAATNIAWNNMLPVTAIIPTGTNITDYFTTNPIPSSTTELCYVLEPGGAYTMTGDVAPGMTAVTFRGDKVDHPTITMTNGSFLNDGARFKLQFIDIDYSSFAGPAASSAIILMNSNFNAAGVALSNNGYLVVPTIAIQSCKITGLKYYLFFDNNKKYAIGSLLIKDCIIGQNTNSFGNATIRFQSGMVKDLTITNSTLYNEVVANGNNRICQISSGNATSVSPIGETWAGGNLTITNSTFWQLSKTAQSYNSNGAFGTATDNITIQNCIIMDCAEGGKAAGDNGFIRRFRRGNNTAIFKAGNNSYWFDGQFPQGEVNSEGNTTGRDNSGVYTSTDPQLTYLGNGEFKLLGAEQIAKRIGDPRWLPAQ
ncbi:hypothetical protein FACS1894182_12030 [Bacteroidia bacterium]|nr:hypothetical protein FACS1894182_12030 [Bacteroidia bacterium]